MDTLEIPAVLKRDKNNVAPFMRRDVPEYVDDATDQAPINHADNLPASDQSWIPPWASTT